MTTMQASSKIKTAFDKGEGASFGLWQMLPNHNISRMLARTPGVDWVVVDCEHGNMDDAAMHSAVPTIAATGTSPIVRIPGMEGWMVKRALDCGAHGILVPLLRTVEEAKKLVLDAKFPPWGRRGFGSSLPYGCFASNPSPHDYLQQANDALLTMVQIETKEALDSVDEIAAIDGVDVLFIGPFDLGINIGHPIVGFDIKPELMDAIQRILTATHKAGKKCGILVLTGEQAKSFADMGFDMISVAIDYGTLQSSMTAHLNAARGLPSKPGGGSY